MTYLQLLKRENKSVRGSFYVVFGGNSKIRQDVVDILAAQRKVKNRTILSSAEAGEYVRWLYGVPTNFCVLHWKSGTDKSGLIPLLLDSKRGFIVILDDDEEVYRHLEEYKKDGRFNFVNCSKKPGSMDGVVKMRGALDGLIFDKQCLDTLTTYGLLHFLKTYSILRLLNRKNIKYKEVSSFLLSESGKDIHVGELLIEKNKQYIFRLGIFPDNSRLFFGGLKLMLMKILLVKSTPYGRIGERATRLGLSFAVMRHYDALSRKMNVRDVCRRLDLVFLYMAKRDLMLDDKSLIAQFLFRW